MNTDQAIVLKENELKNPDLVQQLFQRTGKDILVVDENQTPISYIPREEISETIASMNLDLSEEQKYIEKKPNEENPYKQNETIVSTREQPPIILVKRDGRNIIISYKKDKDAKDIQVAENGGIALGRGNKGDVFQGDIGPYAFVKPNIRLGHGSKNQINSPIIVGENGLGIADSEINNLYSTQKASGQSLIVSGRHNTVSISGSFNTTNIYVNNIGEAKRIRWSQEVEKLIDEYRIQPIKTPDYTSLLYGFALFGISYFIISFKIGFEPNKLTPEQILLLGASFLLGYLISK
ncbi:MAG: hypothetical protein QXJ06_05155 [Candidatus Aenigmatarchaeota archaeon]